MTVLNIQNLSKSYGKIQALNKFNLQIEKGQVFGLLGPNGSGKTTTLGIILGILRQDSGDYTWFEGAYGSYPRLKIGAILETPNFYPYLNADENLDLIRHIKRSNEKNFDELLELVNLSERRKSKFSTYSLGMKQRLAIAATLIGDPEVVIFDEPTNGLDPMGISEVRHILKRIADTDKTVIMASHLLDEVEKICTHVGIMRHGSLLDTGTVGSIMNDDVAVELASHDLSLLRNWLSGRSYIKGITDNGKIIEATISSDVDPVIINKEAIEAGIFLSHLNAKKKRLETEFLEIIARSDNQNNKHV
jgi:ABC-type multidrug transport system ATPase subunit